jgi:hypothetical protein
VQYRAGRVTKLGYSYLATRGAIDALVRLDETGQRVRHWALTAMETLLSEMLTADEKADFTIRIYDRTLKQHRSDAGVWPWEADWFEQALPQPPARVLVAAAGGGREVTWLRDRGYTVDAFEPSARLFAALNQLRADAGGVLAGTFNDLSDAVLDRKTTPLSAFAAQRYDAVLLGCGSVSHVIDPDERTRLFGACDRLAPSGPVLASFFIEPGDRSVQETRAGRFGTRAGRLVARLRGLPPQSRVAFISDTGFLHMFTAGEIESLAAGIGREVIWNHVTYPHITLVRVGDGERRARS